MTELSHDQLIIVKTALANSPQQCRFHGFEFDKLGHESYREPGGLPPRCDSCKQPWRVAAALAALGNVY